MTFDMIRVLLTGYAGAAASVAIDGAVTGSLHGSPRAPPDDLLTPDSPVIASDAAISEDRPRRTITHCHWCGRRCRHWSVRDFCVAAVVAETGCSATRSNGIQTR
jgi:hypothetical protein